MYAIEEGHTEYVDEPLAGAVANPNYDHIIAGKAAYFNPWFFWMRTLAYVSTFLIFARLFRRWSLLEDEQADVDLHFKQFRRSALFLVFFAVFSSMLSWDWVMSIDPHWFSTLFGWYVFASMFVSGITTIALIVIYLKSKGYLENFVSETNLYLIHSCNVEFLISRT